MLLTSSEGGLLCYLAPARDETLEGAEEQQEGELGWLTRPDFHLPVDIVFPIGGEVIVDD